MHAWKERYEKAEAKLANVESALIAADGMCANCYHGDLIREALDDDD
jgi:hypothetical protein